jgi:hypothetical protein
MAENTGSAESKSGLTQFIPFANIKEPKGIDTVLKFEFWQLGQVSPENREAEECRVLLNYYQAVYKNNADANLNLAIADKIKALGGVPGVINLQDLAKIEWNAALNSEASRMSFEDILDEVGLSDGLDPGERTRKIWTASVSDIREETGKKVKIPDALYLYQDIGQSWSPDPKIAQADTCERS